MHYSLCYLIFGSALTLATALKEDSDSYEGNSLKEIIFGHSGKQLYPQETHSLLRILKGIYQRKAGNWPIEDVARVNDLLHSTEMSEERCTLEALDNVKYQLEKYHEFRQNVIPFLEFQLQMQYQFCIPILEAQLEAEVDSWSQDERQRLSIIRKSLIERPSPSKDDHHLHNPSGVHTDGVLSVLEDHSSVDVSDFLEGEEGEALFRQEFDKMIEKPCEDAVLKLKKPLELLDVFTKDDHLKPFLNPFTLEWLENVEVCQQIISHRDALKEDSYEKFEDRLRSSR